MSTNTRPGVIVIYAPTGISYPYVETIQEFIPGTIYLIDATNGAVTVILPLSQLPQPNITFQRNPVDTTTNAVLLNTPATMAYPDGSTSLPLPQNGTYTFNSYNLIYVPENFSGVTARGRFTAQAAAKTVLAYTVGSGDRTFTINANILVTTSTLHTFTTTCTYTDEGNTSRTLTLSYSQLTGTFITAITNTTGASAYEGVPVTIRAKAGTSITIATVGTFTTVAYNVEATVIQLA